MQSVAIGKDERPLGLCLGVTVIVVKRLDGLGEYWHSGVLWRTSSS